MKFSNKIQLVLILLFSLVTSLQAQDKLNNYKYVVVANQFDFQSEPDQYRLNGLTKFLLEKQNLILEEISLKLRNGKTVKVNKQK